MKRFIASLTVGVLLVGGYAAAQSGPYSAQIQRALTSLVASTHTWTATQTFGGTVLLTNGLVGTPSLAFTSATTTGLYWDGASINLAISGTRMYAFGTGNLLLATANASISWADGTALAEDANNLLVQRNGTNAQWERVANTFTDTTHGEWASLDWQTTPNVLRFGTDVGSAGGSARALNVIIGGTAAWQFTTVGNLIDQGSHTFQAGTLNAVTAYQANSVAGITGTCDTPTFSIGIATTCGGAGGSVDGTYRVTSNFTTSGVGTNLEAITGLSWTFPATTALNIPFRCSLVYSQATAAVADNLGIQDVTVAPTNALFTGAAETALGTTAYGDVTAFSSTTATSVVAMTPSAIGTTFNAYIDGLIEQPSNASTSAFTINIKTSTAADLITVYRGSYCKVG